MTDVLYLAKLLSITPATNSIVSNQFLQKAKHCMFIGKRVTEPIW